MNINCTKQNPADSSTHPIKRSGLPRGAAQASYKDPTVRVHQPLRPTKRGANSDKFQQATTAQAKSGEGPAPKRLRSSTSLRD